jgi:hypothetical protein
MVEMVQYPISEKVLTYFGLETASGGLKTPIPETLKNPVFG